MTERRRPLPEVLEENTYFISDLGQSIQTSLQGGQTLSGRYAVWRNAVDKGQLQLVEVGEQLSPLLDKYRIPSERVARVGG